MEITSSAWGPSRPPGSFHWMDVLLSQIDLDSRHMGWVTSELPGGDHHVIKIELKGPENTLRVRQVKVLGWKEGESIKIAGQISASVTQQKNCEAETLRVFRLITSQVRPKRPQYGSSTNVQQTLVLNYRHVCVGVWETNLWRCRTNTGTRREEPALLTRGWRQGQH